MNYYSYINWDTFESYLNESENLRSLKIYSSKFFKKLKNAISIIIRDENYNHVATFDCDGWFNSK